MTEFERLAGIMFPSMPQEFVTAFGNEYAMWADQPNTVKLTLAALRDRPEYPIWFPGNLRDDGSARIGEQDYWEQRGLYEQAVNLAGLPPDIFDEEQYISLIEGETSPREFADRVRTQANEVIARGDEFKAYYAELYGFEPTTTAILQSVFTGNNDALLTQSGIATVGFEAERRDFDVSLQLAASLYDAGIQNQGQAIELFGQAATQVPLFGQLASRHFDPEDEFDLGDLVQATVFNDQEQLDRIQRLTGQERSLFSRSTQVRRNRAGSSVGLVAE